MASYKEISIQKGQDYSLQINVVDTSANPVDLTGASVVAKIKSFGDFTLLATFTCLIVSAGGGIISLSMPASESLSAPYGRAEWDCFVTLGNGLHIKVAYGVCDLIQAISAS